MSQGGSSSIEALQDTRDQGQHILSSSTVIVDSYQNDVYRDSLKFTKSTFHKLENRFKHIECDCRTDIILIMILYF